MTNQLTFSTDEQFKLYRANIDFWYPRIIEILQRHNIKSDTEAITAGYNSTYPVFLTRNVVIKFFGHRLNWQKTYANELMTHKILATNQAICAPSIIGYGELFENSKTPWAYTISTRMPGTSWLNTDLDSEQKHTIVAELGNQLQHIHTLPIDNELKGNQNWGKLDIKSAAKKSSLPNHLIEEVNHFITTLGPFNNVLTHGDLVGMHIFIDSNHLSGIIDWGDVTITDRHYEIGKLCLDIFPGDKALLKTLLDAANWPVNKNFAKQTLGLALYRQAVGLTQHFSFDVFHKLPRILPLREIKNLNELADILFRVCD